MRTALTLVTPPAKEPVTLAEVKAWAKVDVDDDDTLLVTLITAARESAEQYLRRSLITQTWKLTLDLTGSGWANDLPAGVYDLPVSVASGDLPRNIDLAKGPVQSVESVTTYDTANTDSAFASSNYFVDTAGDRLVLTPAASWPSGLRDRAAVAIQYVTGYGTDPSSIPQAIRTAILMHVQRMYDERITCELPDGCQRLLMQYRKYA